MHVAVDNFGYVYVADNGNNRIQKFAPSTTMQATAASGSAVDIKITGTIDSSQMSNLKITSNPTSKTTTLSFTVSGPSGGSGVGIVTIPKSAVTSGTNTIVSIDGHASTFQYFWQDAENYYVQYVTTFSTHTITIEFTDTATDTVTPAESSYATYIAVAAAAAILAVLSIRLAKKRRKPVCIAENP
jgi:hypothetical protein